ncbi:MULTISPECIES: pilus assembly protein [unclassified Tatumella]|uniref:pilus assembly protein n=1 Tax=unclassified Tatumella TaxID=2649542 RepID=UPI001BAFAF14|nr:MULTISPECIES: pilus assembly protein [unclassified Tatumella]MBS0876677.1 pilus assembly protein [Tatumella sp. JGM82]MBS0889936.1 pilus assembly protein [Tatumella sp. JGM94]MBS0901180.1 pilus assembly protein [Tatumella sp. JGM100]
MKANYWHIGLDIQPGQVTALGVQPRRNGWQLRHWWQQPVPCQDSNQDMNGPRTVLVRLLEHWRRLLPRKFSLRVGLPPHLVLQRQLDVPSAVACEPVLGSYIRAAAGRLFPEGSGPLAIDYQPAVLQSDSVSITVASQTVIEQWQNIFYRAGLSPDVFELMHGSLAVALSMQGSGHDRILVHESDTFWLWACYRQGKLQHGWQFRQQCPDAEFICTQQCPEAEARFFCGSQLPPRVPAGFRLFSPFPAIVYRQPPLPAEESSFTLAAGLALRQDDRL